MTDWRAAGTAASHSAAWAVPVAGRRAG